MFQIENVSNANRINAEAAAYHLASEQLNWQRAQYNSMGNIKVEQDEQQALPNWQMSQEQPDTSYRGAEYLSGYDMDVDRLQMQRLGSRQRAKRKKQMKLPDVFKFFGNIERDCSANPDAISATCNACQSRIKGFVTITSNFIKHLRVRHADIHAAFVDAKQSGHTEAAEATERYSFDERVLLYIIDTAQPLATVEAKSFRNLFHGTNLSVMSSTKLEMLLNVRYSQMSSSIKNQIAKVKYVCTSAHIWSSKEYKFFGYTCHWLDGQYQRHSVVLACKRITENSEQLLEMINMINNDYDLNNLKIMATITHSDSNYSRLFQKFGIQSESISKDTVVEDLLESMEFDCSVLPNYVRCANHTLNVIASQDFVELLSKDKALKERHLKIFNKCSLLWEKTGCTKAAATIATVLGERLITPSETRWNSIYDSICCLLLHKEKLADLCSRLSLHNSCFSASDLQYLEQYRILMAPIVSTIEFLHMESNLFYGCLIPTLTSLCVKLKRVSDSTDLIDLNYVAVELQQKLKERFAKYIQLAEEANKAIIASVLCPSVKMRWFNALAKISSHGRSAEEIHRLVIAEAVRHAKATETANQTAVEKNYQAGQDDFYEFDEIVPDDACDTSDLDTSQPSPLPAATKLADYAEGQFHSYLRDPSTTTDMLDKYPLLQELALKYNTPLTSASPIVRGLTDVNMNAYTRSYEMADYSMEKLFLLKANSNFLLLT